MTVRYVRSGACAPVARHVDCGIAAEWGSAAGRRRKQAKNGNPGPRDSDGGGGDQRGQDGCAVLGKTNHRHSGSGPDKALAKQGTPRQRTGVGESGRAGRHASDGRDHVRRACILCARRRAGPRATEAVRQ